MNCQRCMSNEEASYRVFSDVLEMNVCPACAVEALATTTDRRKAGARLWAPRLVVGGRLP